MTPAKIDRTAALYIETRWPPPRRYGRISPGAYVLIDPNAEFLDSEELKQMACELQVRLFGTEGRDDLCMLTYEGGEEEVLRFTSLSETELLAMRAGAPIPPKGRTRLVTGKGLEELAPWGSTPRNATRKAAQPAGGGRLGWRGIYNPVKECFEASQLQLVTQGPEKTVLPDDYYMRADLMMLDTAVAALETAPNVWLYADFRMWSLSRSGLREAYEAKLAALPPGAAEHFSAYVYDVPRDLPFSAVAPIRDVLQPLFRRIELRVQDELFNVQALPENLVQGVVFQMTGNDELQRLRSLRLFLSGRRQYLDRKLRQGVAGLRSRRELELCRELRLSSVSGPIVSALLDAPLPEQVVAHTALPLKTLARETVEA